MDKQQQVTLERDLENWGAWARSGLGSPGSCGSAEGRYVSPKDPDGTHVAHLTREPVRVGDAETVEAAILKMRSRRMQKLLKLVYVEQAARFELAKFLDVSPVLVEPARLMALGMLQYVLDHMPNLVRKTRAMQRGLHSGSGSNKYESPPTNDATAP